MKKLNEVVTTPTAFIFSALQSFDVPWKNKNINQYLDFDYLSNHSGQKIIAPITAMLMSTETGKIESDALSMLANIVFAKYGMRWSKLYSTMQFEYNPIENYNMVETMDDDETVTEYNSTLERTDDLTHEFTYGKTETTTDEQEITTTDDTTNENQIMGFNSDDYVGKEKNIIDGSVTETHSGDITRVNSGTDSENNTGTQTSAHTGNDTQTRNYELRRSGNIGVTTSQQMIEQERKLWEWDFFNQIIYPDLDKVLTIFAYE